MDILHTLVYRYRLIKSVMKTPGSHPWGHNCPQDHHSLMQVNSFPSNGQQHSSNSRRSGRSFPCSFHIPAKAWESQYPPASQEPHLSCHGIRLLHGQSSSNSYKSQHGNRFSSLQRVPILGTWAKELFEQHKCCQCFSKK